jgi:hypothetical protein
VISLRSQWRRCGRGARVPGFGLYRHIPRCFRSAGAVLGRSTSIQSPPKVSSTELELDEEGASKRLLRASSDSGHRIGVPAGAASEMGHQRSGYAARGLELTMSLDENRCLRASPMSNLLAHQHQSPLETSTPNPAILQKSLALGRRTARR